MQNLGLEYNAHRINFKTQKKNVINSHNEIVSSWILLNDSYKVSVIN